MSSMKAFIGLSSFVALLSQVLSVQGTSVPTANPTSSVPSYTIESKVDLNTADDGHNFQGFGSAIDSVGNVYYSDSTNHIISMVNMADATSPTTIAGTSGVFGSTGDGGPASSALTHSPHQMFVNRFDNLLFADYDNFVVRKIDLSTGIVKVVAGSYVQAVGGFGNGGQATSAQLQGPQGVWEDNKNNVYISDRAANVVYKVNGTTGILTFVNAGVSFSAPQGLVGDVLGNYLYVADSLHHVIQQVDLKSPFYTMVALFGTIDSSGTSGDGGPATLCQLNTPKGIFLDQAGNFFITDSGNRVVRRVDAITGVIDRISGTYGVQSQSGDGGPALSATHNGMNQIVGNSIDSLYVAETDTVRDLYTATAAPTSSPTAFHPYTVDSKVADGHTYTDFGVAIDSAGNVYYSDSNHHVLNQASLNDIEWPNTILGTYGTSGNSGDDGPASEALTNGPRQMFVNRFDNLLWCDFNNHVVRKIDLATGDVKLVAGSYVSYAGGLGNGGLATSAKLQGPHGVWEDNKNNVYISDRTANIVYHVNGTTGIIHFMIGGGSLSLPQGLFGDVLGNYLYVADTNDHVIMQIDRKSYAMSIKYGIIGFPGSTGDGGSASLAKLNGPRGFFIDAQGNHFITDEGNRVVRRVDAITGVIDRISGTYGVQSTTGDGGPALDCTHRGINQIVGNNADSLYIAQDNTVRVLFTATHAPSSHPTASPTMQCRPNVTETTVVTTVVTKVITYFMSN